MPDVTVTFNKKPYHLSCKEGGQEHLQHLADFVNEKGDMLLGQMRNMPENRLLLMTSILIADELFDLKDKFESQLDGDKYVGKDIFDTAAFTSEIDSIVNRIKEITEKLDPVG